MFTWLRDRFQPTTLEDPVFGTLRYQRGSKAWEGSVVPPFARHGVGLVVDADEAGPTQAQHAFYRELATRYPLLARDIEDVLLETLQNWDASIGRDDVWTHFTLESMSIPRPGSADASWELVYTLNDDPHYFCVLFEGWLVQGVRVDG